MRRLAARGKPPTDASRRWVVSFIALDPGAGSRHQAPLLGAGDRAGPQATALEVAELVDQKQRVITGAAEAAVPDQPSRWPWVGLSELFMSRTMLPGGPRPSLHRRIPVKTAVLQPNSPRRKRSGRSNCAPCTRSSVHTHGCPNRPRSSASFRRGETGTDPPATGPIAPCLP